MYNFLNTPPYKLANLQDYNPSGLTDKKIVMYNQNTTQYNPVAYTETGFAYNLSTDHKISYALPGRFKWINGQWNSSD